MDKDIQNILHSYALDILEDHGKKVDTLTVMELAPWPLSEEELDFVFQVIDRG